MTDHKAVWESNRIKIYEWPQPICEIYDKRRDEYLQITTPEDAKAIIQSLERFLKAIPVKFGGNKND